jgi:hypothetical protein
VGALSQLLTSAQELDVPTFVGLQALLYLALAAVGHPLDILKTRQQASLTGRAFSASDASSLRSAFRAGRSLYVGFLPAAFGALPAAPLSPRVFL